MMRIRLEKVFGALLALGLVLVGPGCSPKSADEGRADGLSTVRLQANWYAQTSHGGFHQGKATGIYEKHDIDIQILDAGPGTQLLQKVASGDADIGMHRFDSVVQAIDKGLPLVAIATFMYHDAAAFMVHADSPVQTFTDLDDRRVMLAVGSTFEAYFRRQFDIEFKTQPFNWGYAEFMVSPDLIQQCYVTNEPYFVGREGVATRQMLFYETGYDPPQVLFVNRKFLEEHPDEVRRFLAATLESWADFMENDPQPAFDSIHAANPKLDYEHMRFAYNVLIDQHLLTGDPDLGVPYGAMPEPKMSKVISILKDLDMVSDSITVEDCVDASFLPPAT